MTTQTYTETDLRKVLLKLSSIAVESLAEANGYWLVRASMRTELGWVFFKANIPFESPDQVSVLIDGKLSKQIARELNLKRVLILTLREALKEL